MAKGVVATMDTVGFITEPTVKIDRAIAYWFANRLDQCIVLRGIHSYQYVMAKHQDDKGTDERFLEEIKKTSPSIYCKFSTVLASKQIPNVKTKVTRCSHFGYQVSLPRMVRLMSLHMLYWLTVKHINWLMKEGL